MRNKIPESIIRPGHVDFELLNSIAKELIRLVGSQEALAVLVAQMLRTAIDDVIQTPVTGRRSYDQLEKTEKIYIGTRVEISLRGLLGLKKGRLDTQILGHDVDIKLTMGDNWTIPPEAYGHGCILVAADEARAVCFLGLIFVRNKYMHKGKGNRDLKKGVSSEGFANILWLVKDYPYPANFWRAISALTVERIFAGASGNQRVTALFRELQGVPVTRSVIDAVARQKDFTRRVRADGGKGTKDLLLQEGILLLSGTHDAQLIAAYGLPKCARGEYISYTPKMMNNQTALS